MPKYSLVADDLRRLCAQLRRQGESRLPSEQALCQRFACSRQTIRAALALLEQEGLICKKRGSGSYLADGRPQTDGRVVLLVPDENEYLCPALIRELRAQLAAHGLHLVCRNTEDRHARERALLLELLRDPPAAVLLEPIGDRFPNPNADLLEELMRAGVPLACLFGAYEECAGAPRVTEADRDGAAQLVQLLAARGHRRIGGLFRCDDSRGYVRCAGVMRRCAELELESGERDFAWLSGEDRRRIVGGDTELLRLFLRQYWYDCSAVICQNDELAYHLIRELERLGRRVPDDLAVASFGDSYYASAGSVGITSLGHRAHAPAAAAEQAVLAAIAGTGQSPAPLPWFLVERAST